MINKTLGLNKEQLEFVQCKDKNILLLACAGSGKSCSIVKKVSIDLLDNRVNPEHIFTISFTRAAAEELSKRLKRIDKIKGRFVKSMTFHSMCIYFLKKYINKKYTIASETEKLILKNQVSNSFGIKKAMDINKSKDCMRAYKLTLKTMNMLDIELVPQLMLEQLDNDWFKEKVQSEVDYLFYDEAQDINEVQFKVLEKIIPVESDSSLCLIGDYSQNIYSWNGTDPKFLLDFQSKYSAKTIILNKNYRSSTEIIEFSNNFVEKSHAKIDVEGFFSSTPVLYKNISSKEFEIETICRAYNAIANNKTIAFITRSNKDIDYIAYILGEAKIEYTTSQKSIVSRQFIDFARLCINPNSVLVQKFFKPSSEDKVRAIEEDIPIIEILALKNKKAKDIIDVSLKMKKLNAIDGYNLIKNTFNEDDIFLECELEKVEEKFSVANLEQFLNIIETNTEQDNLRNTNVHIATIHATKGLEYDEVVIFNVNNSNFKEKDKDENLRLLYVAATRAKTTLTITYLKDRGNGYNNSIPQESTLLKNIINI